MISWTDRTAHPWRRLFARLLDSVVNGSVTLLVIAFVLGWLAPAMGHALFAAVSYRLADAIMTVAAAIPLNAALIGLTGSSLGKWLFGVRVADEDGRPIGFGKALLRELFVWVQGMGLGIPVVNLITLWLSYSRLEKNGATPWDEQSRHVVLHRPQGPGQIIGVVVGVVLFLGLAVGARI